MKRLSKADLKDFLDEKVERYNRPDFIDVDPITIPHRFSKKEDVEIAGFLSATIAWGNRKSIVTNANRMMALMDESPYEFILHHSKKDLSRFKGFVHRTFNDVDVQYFMQALQHIYKVHGGLEPLLASRVEGNSVATAFDHFKKVFFEINHPDRTRKHVSNPLDGSSSKRLNMYLRWMVRKDNGGVDFGIWNSIPMSALSLPLDVHTGNVGRKLGLLKRTQSDWKAVCEIDSALRLMDPLDPVKYDFALFGLGAIEGF